jgi:hypothetical protein
MAINRTATIERNIEADERRIRGTGLASGVIGQALLERHTAELAEYITKMMRKRPTARKRAVMSLTPEVHEALRGIPKTTLAAAPT